MQYCFGFFLLIIGIIGGVFSDKIEKMQAAKVDKPE
jgi:hypothetical protein